MPRLTPSLRLLLPHSKLGLMNRRWSRLSASSRSWETAVLQAPTVFLLNFSSALSTQLVEFSTLCSYRCGDRVVCLANGGTASSSVSIKKKAHRQNAVATDQSPCCLCQGRFSPMCSFAVYNRYLNLHADHNNLDSPLAGQLLMLFLPWGFCLSCIVSLIAHSTWPTLTSKRRSTPSGVDRIAFWKALRSKVIPDTLTQLIEALHQSTGARVRIGSRLSGRFQSTSGVRQGCILAPTLFCVAIDWILEHMSVRPGINIGNSNIADLVYADDTALLLPSIGDAASCLSSSSTAAAPLGLKISWEKTKLQNLGSGPQPTNISVGGWLRRQFCLFGQCRPDIKRRIGFASSTMSSLSRIWKDKRLTTATKVRLY